MNKTYRPWTSVYKAAKCAAVVLTAVVAVPSLNSGQWADAGWKGYLFAATMAAFTAFKNWRKNPTTAINVNRSKP